MPSTPKNHRQQRTGLPGGTWGGTGVKPGRGVISRPCSEAELLTAGARSLRGPFSTCTEPKEGGQGGGDAGWGLPRTTHQHRWTRACNQPLCTPRLGSGSPRGRVAPPSPPSPGDAHRVGSAGSNPRSSCGTSRTRRRSGTRPPCCRAPRSVHCRSQRPWTGLWERETTAWSSGRTDHPAPSSPQPRTTLPSAHAPLLGEPEGPSSWESPKDQAPGRA